MDLGKLAVLYIAVWLAITSLQGGVETRLSDAWVAGEILVDSAFLSVAGLVMGLRWNGTPPWKWGGRPGSSIEFSTGMASGLLIILFSQGLSIALPAAGVPVDRHPEIESLWSMESGIARGFAMFMLCFLVPLGEEFLFRGALLRWLITRFGDLPGIVCSALLFALVHARLDLIVYAGGVGLLLGWLTKRTNSLIPAFVAHAFANSVGVLCSRP